MADSTKRAQLLRELLTLTVPTATTATTATEELIESIGSSNSSLGLGSSFRQRLVNAQESGQPIPDVTLNNGEKFTNVVVTEVDLDSVLLTDPSTDLTSIVRIEAISSFGTLSPM